MALTTQEQELLAVANSVLPGWFVGDADLQEDLKAAAKIVGRFLTDGLSYVSMCRMQDAAGNTDGVDWLALHAQQRGTRRQVGETNVALLARLQSVPDAVTRPSILSAATKILTAFGVSGTIEMLEMPRDGAFLGQTTLAQGVGGGFVSLGGGIMQFAPSNPWAWPPFVDGIAGPAKYVQLQFTGAQDAGNNGYYIVQSLAGNGVRFTNGSGVARGDGDVVYTVRRLGWDGQPIDGVPTAFLDRGCRLSTKTYTIVLIIPNQVSGTCMSSLAEMLRKKRAAGVLSVVEMKV